MKLKENYSLDALNDMLEVVVDLTDRNDHTHACAVVAIFFKYKKFEKIFKHIMELQDIEGSMPYELGQYRTSVLNLMLELIENKEGKEVRGLVYHSL